jgi:tetratricopeptide (TPR) repeat protein
LASAYPSATADLAEAAEALDVRALVTGRVGEIDGRLVVRAELIDVDERSQLWGAQFDRPMTDILMVQDSLVREIAENLRLELTLDDERGLARQPTENPEAYRLYLLARFHTLSVSPDGLALGRRYAEEAVRLDPGYAPGWTALSDSYLAHIFLGLEPPDEGYPLAREAADRAVSLDDSLSAAYAIRGYVRHHGDWDWEGSIADWEKAIRLDPDNADGWQGLSEGLLSLGRVDEALVAAERGVEADPITPVVTAWLANVYGAAGRHDEALETLQRSLELEPDNFLAVFGIPQVFAARGQFDEALVSLDSALIRFGRDPARDPGRATILARAGRDAEARAILARLDSDAPNQATIAKAWATLGELDRAFDALDLVVDRRETAVWWLKTSRGFDPLRGDPRFDRILERVGLPR